MSFSFTMYGNLLDSLSTSGRMTQRKANLFMFLILLLAWPMPKGFDITWGLDRLKRQVFITLQIAKFLQIARFDPQTPGSGFKRYSLLFLGTVLLALCFSEHAFAAVTLEELRAEPDLTPERFIKHFADFKFELGREVRKPETFLKNQSGDCDDFATLAADVLREKGYTTRLIAIFMPHDVHVVCYVAEINGYLDYNCRKLPAPLVKCDRQLSSIATSVAASFRTEWRSVSEYTFNKGVRQFVSTEFR
jgi:transglutaminase superfamily protein